MSQKAGFLRKRKGGKKKERREGKEENRKKAMAALLVFIMATLEKIFGRGKLLDETGPFGDRAIFV